jgi:magnesium transporter
MLIAFTREQTGLRRIESPADDALRAACWIDMTEPADADIRRVEAATGLTLPSRDRLAEIESSSRMAAADGVLMLSMPLISRIDDEPKPLPGGFVLSRDRLITMRFAASRLFDGFAARQLAIAVPEAASPHLFVGLLEAIVDRHADALEEVRSELDGISDRIFTGRAMRLGGGKHEDRMLRHTLAAIGRTGNLISFIRDSQVAASRLVPYVQTMAKDWLPADLTPRFTALTQDIASLNDFESHLNNKLQFLLDATLGFINIAQNNVMKVLTVASVVGIPPVLIAGIYGMNFKSMPEYDWSWGYAYGLGVILLSALITLGWFKWRDWI